MMMFRLFRHACLLMLSLLLFGCNPFGSPRLADFRSAGLLQVAIHQDAIAYRENEQGKPEGFEFELLMAFGERLGVPLQFQVYRDAKRALDAVLNGEAHLAAGGLTAKPHLPLIWSAALREAEYVIVGANGDTKLDDRPIAVRRGSGAEEALNALAKRTPPLKRQDAGQGDDQTLLEAVAEGRLELAAVDRMHYALAANFHPQLNIVQPLPGKRPVSWAVARDADEELADEMLRFVREAQQSGLLARLADRYYGHAEQLAEQDISVFIERIGSVLPRYRKHFQDAQALTGIDWRLLAALAYQESHWDPLATSPTGVRGMMMLTTDTADRLGVDDRLDPRQSILGGARYLAMLLEDLPEEIPPTDRNWMALAAYNIGQGHFNGARSLARSLKRKDDSWFDIKAVLPLLARPEFAQRLKNGRARGGEAVMLAENVRSFYEILLRFEKPYTPLLQPPRFTSASKRGGGLHTKAGG